MIDTYWPYGSERAKKLHKRLGKVADEMIGYPYKDEDLELLRNMPPDMKKFVLSTVNEIKQKWIFFEGELNRLESVLKEKPQLKLIKSEND